MRDRYTLHTSDEDGFPYRWIADYNDASSVLRVAAVWNSMGDKNIVVHDTIKSETHWIYKNNVAQDWPISNNNARFIGVVISTVLWEHIRSFSDPDEATEMVFEELRSEEATFGPTIVRMIIDKARWSSTKPEGSHVTIRLYIDDFREALNS